MSFASLLSDGNPALVAGVAAAAGVLSHLMYFIRGEHHLEAPGLALLVMVLPAAMFTTQQVVFGMPIAEAFMSTMAVFGGYTGGLLSSMIIYRVFFHSLRGFSGPPMAKFSKLWHMGQLTKADNFRLINGWHKKYGPFVRTGPNEITVASADAGVAIQGPNSKCYKADWYDIALPLISMQTTRNKREHDLRRRVWDKGFGAKGVYMKLLLHKPELTGEQALRDYEGRIIKYTHELVAQIAAFSGKPMNMSKWFNFFAFDVMGDLAFGKSFNMLQSGEEHFAIELLHQGMEPVGTLTPVPWFFRIMTQVPFISAGYWRFIHWCEAQADNRRTMNIEVPDVMHWLLQASEKETDPMQDKMWMRGDSRLIIVAGSDTTAATLTHIFYFLCQYPAEIAKLRAELKPLVPDVNAEIDVRALQNDAHHLNGIINEALRLHPPVPSGVIRITPPEGIEIDGTYIPGNVNIVTSPYTMGRLDTCWVHPNDFIPERWYSKPELTIHSKAFIPFSLGPYGCIGKQLALAEVRVVVAMLILNFDVNFAPGEDGTQLVEGTTDSFTLVLGELRLCFTKIKA